MQVVAARRRCPIGQLNTNHLTFIVCANLQRKICVATNRISTFAHAHSKEGVCRRWRYRARCHDPAALYGSATGVEMFICRESKPCQAGRFYRFSEEDSDQGDGRWTELAHWRKPRQPQSGQTDGLRARTWITKQECQLLGHDFASRVLALEQTKQNSGVCFAWFYRGVLGRSCRTPVTIVSVVGSWPRHSVASVLGWTEIK